MIFGAVGRDGEVVVPAGVRMIGRGVGDLASDAGVVAV